MTELENRLRKAIRDVPDFPEPGILFKDITPILLDPSLCREVVNGFLEAMKGVEIDVVAGVESRGFLFGLPLAMALDVPFVTVRKKGKLPYHTVSYSYDLEYGSAEIEMHRDAIHSGQRVLVHDDLLATGGTAAATSELIATQGAEVVGFTFLVELSALGGRERIETYSDHLVQLVSY
jgi:adenine phosphoribosyltransferase